MTILLFMSMRLKSSRDVIGGVYRAARERGWNVQQFESIPSPAELRELIGIWHPVGCLVYTATSRDVLPPRLFGRIPVVYLSDRHGDRLAVNQDGAAIVALAVEELLHAGSRSLAYVGPDLDANWNRERRAAICEEARRRKLPFDSFALKSVDSGAEQRRLQRFLASLPRPGGVLIGGDIYAGTTLHCARNARLAIPGDVAFVSVDNDEFVCENLRPTLSSVIPDFESAGYQLGQLLAARIENAALRRAERTYGPRGIVRRASSRPPGGHPAVSRALEFIRQEACTGIGVDDVARAMGMSRRTAQRLFARHAKSPIADEIRKARLARAMELVRRRDQPLGPIAQMCGFSSGTHLKTVFRKFTGKTMREFRGTATTSPVLTPL